MDRKKQELKYYSLDNILKKNCVYNIIFGERSNGKTYAVLKYGIEQYFKNGGQIAIIRRWKEDITGKRASDMTMLLRLLELFELFQTRQKELQDSVL